MDVILAQLGAQELAAHSRDAMKTQLHALQRALNDAVNAVKLAEDVQLASDKLSITLFEDGTELSAALLVSTWLRDELVQSLERVVTRALNDPSAAPPKKAPTPRPAASPALNKAPMKRKVNANETEETKTKKKKLKSSSPTIKETATKSPLAEKKKPKSTSALSKAVELTEELAKRKKIVDRVPGLTMLVKHFNSAQKNLGRDTALEQTEVLDKLSDVAEMAVSIMQHGKPQVKKIWVQKFRDNVAEVQEKFPDSAAAFNGYINSLSKIISSFPLTGKEAQQLRMRTRKALEEVKGWKEGHYSIADASQNISFVAEVFESSCSNWDPRKDKKVRELTAQLLDRVSSFKDSKMQAKRRSKLRAWLDEMDRIRDAAQGSPAVAKSPSVASAKKAPKKPAKSSEVVAGPGNTTPGAKSKAPRKGPLQLPPSQDLQPRLANTIEVPEVLSSTDSSDTEPTQREEACIIKVERSE